MKNLLFTALLFLAPLQLRACPECVYKIIAQQIEYLCERIENPEENNISNISDECIQYYFMGQRDAYYFCLEILEEFLLIPNT